MSIEAMKHKCIYPDCPYPCLDLPDCMDAKKQEADELTIAYMSGLYDGKKAPKREWIGLTDEDFKQMMLDLYNIEIGEKDYYDDILLFRAVEAKLRERNT